jgi:plastocyanin
VSVPRRFALLLGLLALGAAALSPMSASPARGATEHVVEISGLAFSPTTLTITAGDTVTWTNADSSPHTASADGGAFDSGNLDQGQSYSHTFTQPGTYSYRCDYHSEMRATIVVEAAAQQPAAAAPSTAAAPAGQPDTALGPVDTAATNPAVVMMGFGLLLIGLSLVRSRPAPASSRTRPHGGWRR